jgi:murein DD-endopeptidase MepM/ murein hydrolase activator NlpD
MEQLITGIKPDEIHPVADFNPGKDRLLRMDFTAANPRLTKEVIGDVDLLNRYITDEMAHAGARYGIGGYLEPRVLYLRSSLFAGGQATGQEEARSIHLGVDIWAAAGTPVYAPLRGTVHSFAFNDKSGDYGATIILQHQTDNGVLHSLYGHLSLKSIQHIQKGQVFEAGALLAWLGNREENGDWPPHLHFQLIWDMQQKEGDYPGVCKPSEQAWYAVNCPNPDVLLQMNRYL